MHVQDHLHVPFVGVLPSSVQVVTLNKDPGGMHKINFVSGFFLQYNK